MKPFLYVGLGLVGAWLAYEYLFSGPSPNLLTGPVGGPKAPNLTGGSPGTSAVSALQNPTATPLKYNVTLPQGQFVGSLASFSLGNVLRDVGIKA